MPNFELCCEIQELRDIATMEGIKGKHFFLEADIKGPSLKLDNTGKAILTVSMLSPSCDFVEVKFVFSKASYII